MTITLLAIGKTDKKELQSLIGLYTKRLNYYVKFELETLEDPKKEKNPPKGRQLQKEGELLLKKLQPSDVVYLMDERGTAYNSIEFAAFLQKQMNAGSGRLVLIIGGPYGFHRDVYERANGMISLSKMTFSHQMVRLFAVEQLYRAFTILRNEPYHHQ